MFFVMIIGFVLGVGFHLANHGLVIYSMIRSFRPELQPGKAIVLSGLSSIVTSSVVIYLAFWIPTIDLMESGEALANTGDDNGPIISRMILTIVEFVAGAVAVVWAGRRALQAFRLGSRRSANFVALIFLTIHALAITFDCAVMLSSQ